MGYNSFQVLKALTVLVKNVPKQMAVWLPQILPPVWATLTTSAEKYVREVVNEGGEEEDVVDSDGEVPDVRMLELLTFLLQVLGFENLVFAIFEFVHALLLRGVLPALLFLAGHAPQHFVHILEGRAAGFILLFCTRHHCILA